MLCMSWILALWILAIPAHGADLYQQVFQNNQCTQHKTPLDSNGNPNWGATVTESCPLGLRNQDLPGSGPVQTYFSFFAGSKLHQAMWRNNVGYARSLNVSNGQIQWTTGGWSNAGSGTTYQAQGGYVLDGKLYQHLWSGNVCVRQYETPLDIFGNPQWGSMVDRNCPTGPHNGTEVQTYFAHIRGNKLHEAMWQGDVGYTREVPVVGQQVKWTSAPGWTQVASGSTYQAQDGFIFAPLQDVVITDLSWSPSNPDVGDQVTFSATVRNRGKSITPHDIGVGFWIDGYYGWGLSTSPLAAGASRTINLASSRWTPGSSGSFELSAIVDDTGRFLESNENNNGATANVSVGGGPLPDVVITNLTWSPSNPSVDDSVQFHATVKNQGNAATPDIVGVGFWVDGYFGWGTADAMAAGATRTISLSGGPSGDRWVPGSSGTKTLTAVADDIDRFDESNEDNNGMDVSITVSGGGGGGGGGGGACGEVVDLRPYVVPSNQNLRVYSRLQYPDGGTAEETFAYRDGGSSHGLDRWFFVKNDSGENWEEFGFDSQYIYRYRDSSWGETCSDGQPAFYQTTDNDRTAFARWLPRSLAVCESWDSPVGHDVDAGYKRVNSCSMKCTNQYEGNSHNRLVLEARHDQYTTIWGVTFNDVIEIRGQVANSDRFFYARNYGLVGFEGPIQGQGVRSGAFSYNDNVGSAPNWVDLCGSIFGTESLFGRQ